MASIQLVDNFVNTAIDTVQTVYTSPSDTVTAIDSFTVANNSNVNASYKAYIVTSGGAESPQRPFKIVVWGENDLGIGIVNQVIPAGASLRVESSALNSLYFTVSGRTVS